MRGVLEGALVGAVLLQEGVTQVRRRLFSTGNVQCPGGRVAVAPHAARLLPVPFDHGVGKRIRGRRSRAGFLAARAARRLRRAFQSVARLQAILAARKLTGRLTRRRVGGVRPAIGLCTRWSDRALYPDELIEAEFGLEAAEGGLHLRVDPPDRSGYGMQSFDLRATQPVRPDRAGVRQRTP